MFFQYWHQSWNSYLESEKRNAKTNAKSVFCFNSKTFNTEFSF
ncbi:hypothetical protein PPIS_b0658 [Pseudoalteromonas piscicida]|uniref:Uncharacterized protein n=1 Tax=Pseudoalteromonas piscicida TaxID=43662 RepID=A0ABN5CMA0_PSEO7|nr:hypothetical protein PPIS_b0658 [Pseudoalteromonas piscicida]